MITHAASYKAPVHDHFIVASAQVHQMAPLGNGWVDCNMKEQYRFVRLQLHSGHVHHQSLQIEEIPTERAGAVAACVGPLFSHRPDIHNWMFHMMQLGVHRFHMYLPTIHAHEKDAFEAVHEMWMTVKDFNFRHGETHTDPFHPFETPPCVMAPLLAVKQGELLWAGHHVQ